jgi:orotate phosphoribosyltransferase
MGNLRLAVVMMVRMKMIFVHSDDKDHGTNHGQEIKQS